MNDPVTASEMPLNIFLVDDDDMDAKALERAFRKAQDRKHDCAGGGRDRGAGDAERRERQNETAVSAHPAGGLNMPRMNGIELVQALRADEELQQSIVFILTTSKRDEDKMAAYDLHVAGYISKATAAEDMGNLVSLMDSYGRVVELP